MFVLGSLSAISPALCILKQMLLWTVKRLSISKCKRKKCTKTPDISFSPFCGFSLLVLPLLEADKKMSFIYYAEMSLRTSEDLIVLQTCRQNPGFLLINTLPFTGTERTCQVLLHQHIQSAL